MTKTFSKISTVNDHGRLQENLDELHVCDWSNTWKLKFNAAKCKVLHFNILISIITTVIP